LKTPPPSLKSVLVSPSGIKRSHVSYCDDDDDDVGGGGVGGGSNISLDKMEEEEEQEDEEEEVDKSLLMEETHVVPRGRIQVFLKGTLVMAGNMFVSCAPIIQAMPTALQWLVTPTIDVQTSNSLAHFFRYCIRSNFSFQMKGDSILEEDDPPLDDPGGGGGGDQLHVGLAGGDAASGVRVNTPDSLGDGGGGDRHLDGIGSFCDADIPLIYCARKIVLSFLLTR
jgi:hypothetical protein